MDSPHLGDYAVCGNQPEFHRTGVSGLPRLADGVCNAQVKATHITLGWDSVKSGQDTGGDNRRPKES